MNFVRLTILLEKGLFLLGQVTFYYHANLIKRSQKIAELLGIRGGVWLWYEKNGSFQPGRLSGQIFPDKLRGR